MPIEALPEGTTRAISSTLALNDAKSVIKELVDNALDARATAISVEISPNTLDVIQVKDNGTGIGIEDRQLICKRGCTSKIRTLDDLNRLGGTFLGFRGEALSSIAELSQSVTVTTRIDGEVAATTLKYASTGMINSSSTSHPVGTTFRIQDFLQKIPVRKQTALKDAAKTLQAIKALLAAFAFARPNVRLSLKVLKSKTDKGNFTYAPSPRDRLKDIAAKLAGKDVAAECEDYHVSSADEAHLQEQESDGWELDALLLRPDADKSKARHPTQYISVDGRPITSDRGTMKEVVKMYKRYLHTTRAADLATSTSKPFLYMQIRCPPESYDVNIEPAKDEVLFYQPAKVLSFAEKLFQRAYGHAQACTDDQRTNQPEQSTSTSLSRTSLFSTSLNNMLRDERRTQPPLSRSDEDMVDEEVAPKNLTNPFTIAAMNARIPIPRMEPPSSAVDGPSVPSAGEDEARDNDIPRSSHRTPLGRASHLPSPTASPDGLEPHQDIELPLKPWKSLARERDHDSTMPEDINDVRRPIANQMWLTPSTSGHRPFAWHQTVAPGQRQVSSEDTPVRRNVRQRKLPNDSPESPASSVQTRGWGPGQKPFKTPFKATSVGQPNKDIRTLISPSGVSFYESDPTMSSSNPSLVPDPDDVEARDPRSGGLVDSQGRRQGTVDSEEEPLSNANAELAEIMDFEHRKKAVIAQQKRLRIKSSSKSVSEILSTLATSSTAAQSCSEPLDSGSPRGFEDTPPTQEDFASRFNECSQPSQGRRAASNPHHNRYLAAVRALSKPRVISGRVSSAATLQGDETSTTPDSPEEEEEDEAIVPMSDDDPRAYLIRQSRRHGSKIHRTKSSKLPLESIPMGTLTLYLGRTSTAFGNMKSFRKLTQDLQTTDPYLKNGNLESAALSDETMFSELTVAVRDLIQSQFRRKPDDGVLNFAHIEVELPGKPVS